MLAGTRPIMKRVVAGISLVTLSLLLLVAGRADAQKRPGRMPYDIFDRSRPGRSRIAPPPPVIPSAPARPSTARSVPPGVPTREFKLPQVAPPPAPGYETEFDMNLVSSQL